MTALPALEVLLHQGDLDGLVVAIDRLAASESWTDLFAVRDRCLHVAEQSGRQLWPAAQYAAYRIALEAPGELAATVLRPGAAKFALGPLTEVAAQHHRFDEIAPHLDLPMVAATYAQERVVRGEDLTSEPAARPDESGLPPVLQPWEPAYPLPTYRSTDVIEAGPAPPAGDAWDLTVAPGRPASRPEVVRSLEDVARPWVEAGRGEVHVACTDGGAGAAVAALMTGPVRLWPVDLPTAFAWLVWAGGTGGAYGRRRGLAAGRGAAFWFGQVLTGTDPLDDPDEYEFGLEEHSWYVFSDGDDQGWRLRLAVESPDGLGVAIDAWDRRHTDDVTTPPEQERQ